MVFSASLCLCGRSAAAPHLAILAGMSRDPDWLPAARELCRANNIDIAGWGPMALVVYAKTPERAREIASLLGSLGLQPVADPADAEAGLLTLRRSF